jgi:hypothetical protein
MSTSSERQTSEIEAEVTECFHENFSETKNIAYAIVMAFNYMVENTNATTQSGINSDLRKSAETLTSIVKLDRLRRGRTLLSVVSLCRIY